ALHVIYGNGRNDATIDRSVRAVRPSWRADSLALAYAGAGGKAIVYDLSHERRSISGNTAPVTHLAFAPSGKTLAIATPDSALLGGKKIAKEPVGALGWLRGRLAVATPGPGSGVIRLFSPDGASRGSYAAQGSVVAVTQQIVVVRRLQDLLAGHATLLTIPRAATLRDLAIG